jgi:hypothetical protein
VLLSVLHGRGAGLLAGFKGGWIEVLLMRLCDVMLSFPAILVALLIAGVGRALFPQSHETLAFGVLIVSITLTGWVQYARTVRGSHAGRAQQRVCAGRPRDWRAGAAHHAPPCAAQCAGAGAGAGHHSGGHGHHHRGHAVAFWAWARRPPRLLWAP